ncbi:MAG: hydantoinase/oxoprolinase N-terminal domain-containing protein, partial [Nitrospinota bacterium]
MAAPGYRIGADIGGTFTDLVFCRGDGSIRVRKLPSSPEDYARPVLEAVGAFLAEERLGGEAVSELVHGTTVATNAILQRAGARTGLLTTRGFRDVLEIRRVRLPKLYDLTWEKPPPLVPRRLRLEVDERLDARGQVIRPLSEGSAQEAIRELSAQGVESVAVCFLHAYANDAHERRLEELLREMLPGVPVSLSSRVLPKMREYERTATTVVNAYLQPLVQGYLENLQAGLRAAGLGAPLRLMQSNGGLLSAGVTTERPVHLVESGPAAGVIAALGVARQMDMQNALTLDVGGTTAKASIIEGGELSWTAEIEVGAEISRGSRLIKGAGYPIGLPTVDIAEVGAGGGSVAWLEAGGTLRVGP